MTTTEYPKIQTVFMRDMGATGKTLMEGHWTLPEFEYLADNRWIFTEKVDGMNVRVIYRAGVVIFAGRTDAAQMPPGLLNELARVFSAPALERAFPGGDSGGVVLYGEGYGAGIQAAGKKYNAEGCGFALFDVRVGPWWLRRQDVEDVGRKLGCEIVPSFAEGTLHDAVRLARSGIQSAWGDFRAEGIVARPEVELCDRSGRRIIAKIKSRDFERSA